MTHQPAKTVVALSWEGAPPDECRGGAVAVGNFDGVHLGHASLLAELRRQAQALGGPAVVVTFDPHPLRILRPEQFLPLLTVMADRGRLLLDNGADRVVVLQTTPSLLNLGARQFFDEVLRKRLGARAVVEGENFAFGHDREGTVATLAELCGQEGVGLTVVPPFRRDGVLVSSSRIRDALNRGDVAATSGLLGRRYSLRGVVGTGQRRGATLGFPTANLEQIQTVIPGDGVYAVRVTDPDGRAWPGAANLGPNPTFGEQARKVEVHLIGYEGDLYGRELSVEFAARLRDTRPFRGPDELAEQLRRDVEQARALTA
jgi:riboflavin kinase/FMN adenylyltransferase